MIKSGHPSSEITPDRLRAALVVAHPGHELSLYGWLKLVRPKVFVLTDGSGHSGHSRIERTTQILQELGAERGLFYGRFSDVAIYDALLTHQFDLFVNLARELADEIISKRINCIVGDAYEGYNPTHDVCRLIVNAAVAMAEQASGRKIDNLQFLVTSHPHAKLAAPHAQPTCLRLDEATFAQKLMAARNYLELKDEVDAFISAHSVESLRTEYLYRASEYSGDGFSDEASAYYEQHGEKRVKQGYYRQVIRYREHVLPLALTLRRSVNKSP
jgi:hypothetical protein